MTDNEISYQVENFDLKAEGPHLLTGLIVEAIKKDPARYGDMQTLEALAPHLKPEEVRALTGPIIEAIKGARNPELRGKLAWAVVALAPHLVPEEAQEVKGPIIESIKGARRPERLDTLAKAVAALAPHLKPEEMRALTGPIVEEIKSTIDRDKRFHIKRGRNRDDRSHIKRRREPFNRYERSSQDAYWDMLSGETIVVTPRGVLAQAVAVLAPHLEPEEVRALTGPLVEEIRGAPAPGRLATLAQVVLALVPHLKPEGVGALTGPIVEAIKGMTSFDQLGDLTETFVALAPHLKPEEVRALTGLIVGEMQIQRPVTFDTANALAALAQQLPWPERLNLFVSVLKYPTIYGKSRDVLVEATKGHPAARTIKPPGDVWAVVEWLKTQRGVDLTTPPQRTNAAAR